MSFAFLCFCTTLPLSFLQLTWADLVIVNVLEVYGEEFAGGSDQFWADFPKLKAHRSRVEAHAIIAQWIKERPQEKQNVVILPTNDNN